MKAHTSKLNNFQTKLAKKNTISKTAKKQIKGGIGNQETVDY